MDINTLKQLAKQGESNSLEYKTSTARLKSACETLCAFLNANGGTLLIGVSDDGHLVGQEISEKTKRTTGNEIAKIAPVPNLKIDYILLPDSKKSVIVIQVTSQMKNKPYSYNGRAYLRVETNTLPMPREYYNHFLSESAYQNNRHWEDDIVLDVTVDDLDQEEIIRTIKEGVANGRIPKNYATNDVTDALKHFGLLHNKQLTNAAIVLFAKHPEKCLPQCLLKLGRFKGTTHLDEFIDNKQVFGNAFTVISEAMTFAYRYLPIASYFPENQLERKDVPLFPVKVLREVFANAVCHALCVA